MCRHGVLLIHDCHIASREYALHASTFIAAFRPVCIHELCDEDAVIRENGEITGIRWMVFVEGGGYGERGRSWRGSIRRRRDGR